MSRFDGSWLPELVAAKRKGMATPESAPRAPTRERARESAVLLELGRRVRHARLEAGLSQEDAASRARIDYKRWQRLEAGGVNATTRTLLRVAEAVEQDFWELFQNEPGSET